MIAERWAVAEVDLDAIAHNVELLRRVAGDAELWAVVKADGYGHGAVAVARTAVDAGAAGLCVALTQEAVELRAAGLDAPILLLSQQPVDHAATIVELGLSPTVYTIDAVEALGEAAERASRPVGVHLKIDTGMQRVGARPDEAAGLVRAVEAAAGLEIAGIFTHLAVADGDAAEHVAFTDAQLRRFDDVLAGLDLGPDVRVHTANSAGIVAHPAARRRLVRAGIAIYGISPGPGVDRLDDVGRLLPAMSLRARVSFVKRVAAGSRISYGLRHRFTHETTVVTVPIGYADGVRRRLGLVGGEVLVGGRRRPIVGVVTMDQLMVDVGDDTVAVGDEVVLIGRQGDQEITATDWAEQLDTIGYEIVCGISARVPRRHVGGRDSTALE